jgi:hypothetical protein
MRTIATATAVTLFAIAAPSQNQGLALQNGTTAHVDVPFAPALVPSGGLTAEAWLTYDGSALASGWRFPTALRMDPSPNQASWFLRVEAGQTRSNRLLWWVSTTNGDFSIGWNFAAGRLLTWTHVAGTYDGSALRLFVDGVQVAQGAGTGTIQNRGGTLRIGSGDLTVTGGETWHGELDEVRVWPFARSATALASTAAVRLAQLPGEVATWNLDGDALDSSGQNHGTAVGAAGFAPNSLVLTPPAFPSAFAYGAATGCRSDGLAAVAALPQVGNQGFGFVGTRAPANTGGFWLLSLAALPVPQTILGVDLLVDPALGASLFTTTNALGTCDAPFPLPNQPAYIGTTFHTQFGWLDPGCAAGISATDAVFAILLP